MAGKAKPDAPRTMKVRAVQMVFYGNARRRPGTVFTIAAEHFPSFAKAVVEVDPDTPEPLVAHPTSAPPRSTQRVMDEDNPLGAD